ncbi:hypothetical protein OsJ_23911 [Oryza sativa Japonica Group]|uniref:Uncharacterized protein n=1 Tax=Oryza sativa subsp. japonica TaxID=39947 RepID=B9FWR3_ORYSJ|nr:hypothetical protein OsJ_23911 [Oryza sativa Japonica Group]
MASSYVLSLLRRRRRRCTISTLPPLLPRLLSSSFSHCPSSLSPAKPPSLSARLSFVFDQLDALDRSRFSDHSARDAALRRIQSWRRPAALPEVLPAEGGARPAPEPGEPVKKEPEAVDVAGKEELERMSVAEQKYFDLGGTGGADEGCVAAAVPMDLAEVTQETGFDFSRDWTTVKNACMNFGRDRFDIVK